MHMNASKQTVPSHPRPRGRRGFTLVELLVVIGIIGILIGILIPTVGKVRQAAYGASTQSTISQLQNAIERYYQDFHAYPGPIPNGSLRSATFTLGVVAGWPGDYHAGLNATKITGAENLVLGLLGGLRNTGGGVFYDPTFVGRGPMSLTGLSTAKVYPPYLESLKLSWKPDAADALQTGHFFDEVASADDSIIPEFVDAYSHPMPILYLRASAGGQGYPAAPGGITIANNNVITPDGVDWDSGGNRVGVSQYGLNQILGYTTNPIGMGKTLKEYYVDGVLNTGTPTHGLQAVAKSNALTDVISGDPTSTTPPYSMPARAYPYFLNPSLTNTATARAKDGYILISAGPDRVYGTEDDITSFGKVVP